MSEKEHVKVLREMLDDIRSKHTPTSRGGRGEYYICDGKDYHPPTPSPESVEDRAVCQSCGVGDPEHGKVAGCVLSQLPSLESEITRQTPAIIERFIAEVEGELKLVKWMDDEDRVEFSRAMQTVKGRSEGGEK